MNHHICFMLVFTLLLQSCVKHHREKSEFIPAAYRYAVEKIGRGKTFTYAKVGDTLYREYTDLQCKGQCLRENRYAKEPGDISLFDLHHRMMEYTSYMTPDSKSPPPIKWNIKSYHFLEDGTKTGCKSYVLTYTGSINKGIIEGKESYMKDTIVNWEGTVLPCIVTKADTKIIVAIKFLPILHEEMDVTDINYYAKGVGLIRFITETERDTFTVQLRDIKDMK